jgi:hypothetical protein
MAILIELLEGLTKELGVLGWVQKGEVALGDSNSSGFTVQKHASVCAKIRSRPNGSENNTSESPYAELFRN